MAIERSVGKTLKVGLGTDYKPIPSGVEMQSGSNSASGELKTYRDKNGTVISLYAIDEDDQEWQGEALMLKSGYVEKTVGEEIDVSGAPGKWVVKSWEEVYSNEDVVKVRFTIHKYADVSNS